MNWKQELGSQLRAAREASGLTQTRLARRLHVSRQMVSRYENGVDPPAVEVLALAVQVLDVEFEIRGIKILASVAGRRRPVPVGPKQLAFDYDEARKFRGAIIEITPQKGRLFIKAVIPA
jgi:transcriptional regulator with XRE-family HTH domain